jgi:hypothetical protein
MTFEDQVAVLEANAPRPEVDPDFARSLRRSSALGLSKAYLQIIERELRVLALNLPAEADFYTKLRLLNLVRTAETANREIVETLGSD